MKGQKLKSRSSANIQVQTKHSLSLLKLSLLIIRTNLHVFKKMK